MELFGLLNLLNSLLPQSPAKTEETGASSPAPAPVEEPAVPTPPPAPPQNACLDFFAKHDRMRDTLRKKQ